ncbi:MAG: DinB family protein [Candidatus Hodarchaeales archaeon]
MKESEYKIILFGLNEQYGATIEMLEKLIDLCPSALWNEEKIPSYWQVIYHTMWYLDFYLSGDREERENFIAPFGIVPQLNKTPEHELSKEECLRYLTMIRDKTKNKFSKLSVNDLIKPSVFEWHGGSILSSLLYNIRHVMLHIGALNVRLRNAGVEFENWIGHEKL